MNKGWSVLFSLCVFLVSCTGKSGGGAQQEDVKLEQYLVEGQQLYVQNCSSCHQREGEGLAKLFPPLNQSDYLDNNIEGVICIIRNGMKGAIVVNGVEFNQPMPANPKLTALEIAEITTYIYNSWGRAEGLTSVKDVEKVLKTCPTVK